MLRTCCWARLQCDDCGSMDIAHTSKEELFKLCRKCPHCKTAKVSTIYLPGFGQTSSILPFVSQPMYDPQSGDQTRALRVSKKGKKWKAHFGGNDMNRIMNDERKQRVRPSKVRKTTRSYAKGTRT